MLSPRPGTALLCSFFVSAACLAAQPDLASGDSLDPDQLEAKGIYMFDGVLAAAVLYGLEDMSHEAGSAENLLNLEVDWIAGAKPFRSTAKRSLLAKRGECGTKRETFARSDCAKEVMGDFERYGRLASSAKFLRIDFKSSRVSWDGPNEALIAGNGREETFGADGTCMANAICTPVGAFAPRNFKFVVCLHLPANFTNTIQAGHLPEAQARALSTRYGDIGHLSTSIIAELTHPVKALAQPQQCPLTGNKVWAEGTIAPRAMTFGDSGNASFVATSLKYLPR